MINLFPIKPKLFFILYSGFFSSVIFLYPQASAVAAGINENISINADHMLLSVESGQSIYSGNVTISQGKLILTGDKITVQQKNNAVQMIIILGKPARYENISEDGETIVAESEKMVYRIAQNKLEMTTNAVLQQSDHRVSSQKIIYDTKKKIIIAGDKNETSNDSSNTINNRVNITLTPKKTTPEK